MKNIVVLSGAILSFTFSSNAMAHLGIAATIANCTQQIVSGSMTTENFDHTLDVTQLHLNPSDSKTRGCIGCQDPPTFSFSATTPDESLAELAKWNATPITKSVGNTTVTAKLTTCPQGGNQYYLFWKVIFSDKSIPKCGDNIGCPTDSELSKIMEEGGK